MKIAAGVAALLGITAFGFWMAAGKLTIRDPVVTDTTTLPIATRVVVTSANTANPLAGKAEAAVPRVATPEIQTVAVVSAPLKTIPTTLAATEPVSVATIPAESAAAPDIAAKIMVVPLADEVTNAASSGKSGSIRLNANPAGSLYWRTILSDRQEIRWTWPDHATCAQLVISTGAALATNRFDRSETACRWIVPAPKNAQDEKVYTLTMTFLDANLEDIQTLSATGISRVGGTPGLGTRLIADMTDHSIWHKAYTPSAVLPLPVGITALRINGISQTPLAAPGWYGWSPIIAQMEYTLGRFTGDDAETAKLFGAGAGTIFRFD